MDVNLLLLSDSYKISHWLQYPPNTAYFHGYFESRGGKFQRTVFVGLQALIKQYFTGQVVTAQKIAEADEFYQAHFGQDIFNRDGWEHILHKHNGHLPIVIKSIPEGSIVPVKNVLFTVKNTDPKCWWLPGFLETLLVEIWFPMTVATAARATKEVMLNFDVAPISLFLANEMSTTSSLQSSAIGGFAHAIQFDGVSCFSTCNFIKKNYNGVVQHLPVTFIDSDYLSTFSDIKPVDVILSAMDTYPNNDVVLAIDNISISTMFLSSESLFAKMKECTNSSRLMYFTKLKERQTADSVIACLENLAEVFGTDGVSEKRLPKYLRYIVTDNVNFDDIQPLYEKVKRSGWDPANIAIGNSSMFLQELHRDTQKCAFKCSAIETTEGDTIDVFKDPITAPGKKSKKGRLSLHKSDDGVYATIQSADADDSKNILLPVFENGHLLREVSMDEIKATADAALNRDISVMQPQQ